MVSALSGSRVFPPPASCHEGSLFSHGWNTFSCEDCAIRIKNFVSKYFIEYIEFFFPHTFYDFIVFVGKSIYWDLKECRFGHWLEQFKSRVEHVQTTKLYEAQLQIDANTFISSPQYRRLKERFPVIEVWKKKQIDWTSLNEGVCFGNAVTAMKYHRLFDTRTGFKGIEAPDKNCLGNEAIFFQSLHELRSIHEGVLTIKKRMVAQHITEKDLLSKEEAVREAWLFHFLRKVYVSRLEARYLSETFPELFALSSYELQQIVESCDRIVDEELCSAETLNPQLHEKYSSEKNYEKRTQSELDKDICRFLSVNSGHFVLLCGGQKKIGHAMFLKVEQGKCVSFDPATELSFVTDHTADGIFMTIELMKKILIKANFGSNLYYKVMSLTVSQIDS